MYRTGSENHAFALSVNSLASTIATMALICLGVHDRVCPLCSIWLNQVSGIVMSQYRRVQSLPHCNCQCFWV